MLIINNVKCHLSDAELHFTFGSYNATIYYNDGSGNTVIRNVKEIHHWSDGRVAIEGRDDGIDVDFNRIDGITVE